LKTKLFLFLFVLFFIKTFAQKNDILNDAYLIFDNIVGQEKTKLYNGKRYYNIYKSTKNNHNFFNTPDYVKGNVVYDGDPFFNVDLKYDLLNDQLIFRPSEEKSFVNTELIKDKVLKFSFNDHQFINAKSLKNNSLVSGFLEVIYSSSRFNIYAKRKKTVTERIINSKLTYLFSNEPSFYIIYKEQLTKIDSKKTFRKIFNTYSKELKTEINKNKKRFNKNNEGLYLYLAQWIDFKLNAAN